MMSKIVQVNNEGNNVLNGFQYLSFIIRNRFTCFFVSFSIVCGIVQNERDGSDTTITFNYPNMFSILFYLTFDRKLCKGEREIILHQVNMNTKQRS